MVTQDIIKPVLGTIVAVKTLDILGQTIRATKPRKKKRKAKRRGK